MKKQVYVAPKAEPLNIPHYSILQQFSVSASVDEWEVDDNDIDIEAKTDL